MDNNGTGMATPPNSTPSGAVTSQETPKKKPNQGKFRSSINDQRVAVKIDTNRHGIRRETSMAPKKTGRPKKV